MVTSENSVTEKLVQGTPRVSFDGKAPRKVCTKKRIRYVADPRIESYKTGGKQYYRYRRGIDRPEYLGTAEFILQAVTFYREHLKREFENEK